jgi:hypothetical protein
MKTTQRFIENRGPFSLFRLSLIRTREKTASGNWLFQNIWTRKLWERYEYDYQESLKLTKRTYRTVPYPITSELIEITINSAVEDEIKGACRLLYELEFKTEPPYYSYWKNQLI